MKTTRRSRRGARRLFAACAPGGVVDEHRARAVTRRLADARVREALAILTDFHRLVRLDRERHSAVVESVLPLPADVRQEIEAELARRYGANLRTTYVQSPALIAGIRIRVGSDVYDGSVRARLRALESRF
jgi:F-type H+-transporting ATPase subunit delta